MSISQSQAYAGDVSPGEAFEMLSKESQSVLVDVRTQAEWQFVGVPDLSPMGKTARRRVRPNFPSAAPPQIRLFFSCAAPAQGLAVRLRR